MRTVVITAACFSLAFLILAALKTWRPDDQSARSDTTKAGERRQLTRFWDAYHRATELRIGGDLAGAGRYYQAALEMQEGHEESLYYLASCRLEMGDYVESAEALQRLIEANPRSHRGYSLLGILYSSLEPGAPTDLPSARDAFLKNAELDPEESGPFLRIGRIALLEGNLQEALGYFEKAAGSASPEGHFWCGYVHYLQGDSAQAERRFREVLEIGRHERTISGRGGRVEGDTHSATTLSPLARAEIKAQLFLRWILPDPSNDVESPDPPRLPGQNHLTRLALGDLPPAQAAAWGDFDGDGVQDLALACGDTLYLLRGPEGRSLDLQVAGSLTFPRIRGIESVDYDGDGRADLSLLEEVPGGQESHRLLRSVPVADHSSDPFQFQDPTAEAGLAGRRSIYRLRFARLSRSRLPHLIEMGIGGVRYFENEAGRFTPRDNAFPGTVDGTVVDAAIADVEGDGDLDLYLARWRREGLLLANDGSGKFHDVTAASGLAGNSRESYAALFTDFNRDGRPDLLVSSYAPWESSIAWLVESGLQLSGGYPVLFLNQGGRFQRAGPETGLNRPHGIAALAAGDFDGDGWEDLLLVNGGSDPTRLEPSLLLRNQEGQRYVPHALIPGFEPSRSWGIAVADPGETGRVDFYLSGVGLFGFRR